MDKLLWPHLHLYPQPYNHAEAWMVGDRESLTAIRDAITRVLEGPDTATSVRAIDVKVEDAFVRAQGFQVRARS